MFIRLITTSALLTPQSGTRGTCCGLSGHWTVDQGDRELWVEVYDYCDVSSSSFHLSSGYHNNCPLPLVPLLSWTGGRVRLTSLWTVFIWSSRRNNIQFIVWYVVVGDDWNKEPVWVIVVILGDVRYNTPLMHLSALELNWIEFRVSTAHSKGGLMIWADPHP